MSSPVEVGTLPRQIHTSTNRRSIPLSIPRADKPWKHPLSSKAEGIIRFGSHNFGGLISNPKLAAADDDIIRQWVDSREFDIYGIQEVNLNWSKVSQPLQFQERLKTWWPQDDFKAVQSHNIHWKSETATLWGGTAIIARDEAASRYVTSGRDKSGLGRWSWTLLRGKQNTRVRVVSAYRPNLKRNTGTQNPYAQQREYFNSQPGNREPRNAILEDLSIQVQLWQAQGDKIIILMDCNEDTRSKDLQAFAKECGIKEIIQSSNLTTPGESPPNTYIDGSAPIDAIFVSQGLTCVSAGYCGFFDGPHVKRADHRCLWVDFHIEALFGHRMAPIVRAPARRMNLSDPRISNRFLSFLSTFVSHHDLLNRAEALADSASQPLSLEQQEEAESLDRLKQEAIAYADKHCRKLKMGGVPYSPDLKVHQCRIAFWKCALKKKRWKNARNKKHRKVSSRLLQRYAKKGRIKEPIRELMELSTATLSKRLDEAYDDYHTFKPRAASYRKKWYQDLAESRAREEIRQLEQVKHRKHRSKQKPNRLRQKPTRTFKKATSTQLNQILANERSRSSARRIKRAVGKSNLGGTTLVQAQDINGNWVEFTSKEEIERECQKENKRRFQQTKDTPPMTPPISWQLNPTGTNSTADSILNGEFEAREGTNEYAAILLEEGLSRVEGYEDIPCGVTTLELASAWKNAKEKTSSHGPIHFSHYKAIATHAELLRWETAMMNIPMRSGYVYLRWRKCIDVMILKKVNSLRVTKLRTIVLFEADFNMMNKCISKKLANTAEKRNALAIEQFGSRKRHKPIEHAVNKRVALDLLRQRRIAGALCTNDLKSCYDRIVHSVASLSLQRQGIQKSEVTAMFSTLQGLEHHIRTSFGDSDTAYDDRHDPTPMQGIYQGNGAGPLIWAAESSPLFHMMRRHGHGINLKTTLSGQTIRIAGFAFVDDTDLMQTGKDKDDVFTRMQEGLHMWEGLVRATGGGLVVEDTKSSWWLLAFDWKDDGSWEYSRTQAGDPDLVVTNFDGCLKPIQRLEADQAFETLGIMVSPDGDQKAELQHLLSKTDKWASNVSHSTLQGQDAATAYKSTIFRTIAYPLPATTFSPAECKQIQRSALRTILPRYRINRNFPPRLLHASGRVLGMGFPDAYATQLSEHSEILLRHGPQPTLTGLFLRGTIEAAKLEIGLPTDLFSSPYAQVSRLSTESWIKDVWHEFHTSAVHVQERTPNLAPQRDNDQFLIRAFLSAGITGRKLLRLNRCRLRNKIISLSDMTTGDGRQILPDCLQDCPQNRRLDIAWPTQGPLPSADWLLWKQSIRTTFCKRDSLRLAVPLGHWTSPHHSAAFDSDTNRIFLRAPNDTWHTYQRDSWYNHTVTSTSDRPPPTALGGHAWLTPLRLVTSGWSPSRLSLPPSPPTSFLESLQSTPPHDKWAIEYTRVLGDVRIWIFHLIAGTAIAVADGSLKHKRGTAAFILTHDLHTHASDSFLQGAARVPGTEDDQASYRSELVGILGILIVLKAVLRFHPISYGKLTIALDNLEAGKKGLEWDLFPTPSVDHFDVLRAIHLARAELPVEILFRHVEGHQLEKYGSSHHLDMWAMLNEDMDHLAKTYWAYATHLSDEIPTHLHKEEWTATIHGTRICRQLKRKIAESYLDDDVMHWWKTKRHKPFTAQQIGLMDLDAAKAALESVHHGRRRWVCKFAANYAPTGRNMRKWKFWDHDKCPRCACTNEDVAHVWTCPSASDVRDSAIDDFISNLDTIGTRPDIARVLTACIPAWLRSEPIPTLNLLDDDLAEAILHQTTLGWHQLMLGRIATDWGNVQSDYTTPSSPYMTNSLWRKQLILSIWDLSWKLWDNRNDILHSQESLVEAYDMKKVNALIRSEWRAGPGELDPIDRAQFQSLSLPSLLSKTSEDRRNWLRYIQTARAAARRRRDEPQT